MNFHLLLLNLNLDSEKLRYLLRHARKAERAIIITESYLLKVERETGKLGAKYAQS